MTRVSWVSLTTIHYPPATGLRPSRRWCSLLPRPQAPMSTSETAAGYVASTPAGSPTGTAPILVVVDGTSQRTITLDSTPFTVGRNKDNHLVIADGHVSRNHAGIVLEGGEFFLLDHDSRHGTFVNGERVKRHKLKPGDQLYFGALRGGAYVIFDPDSTSGTSATHDFLSQIAAVEVKRGASDLR